MRNVIHLLCLSIFCFLFIAGVSAQQWFRYSPTVGYDINTVDILKPGWIVIGGGLQIPGDSFQLMFQTPDNGVTWIENVHDGYADWNKSIAFADTFSGFGVGPHGRIINTGDGGYSWPNVNNIIDRDFNKIVNVSPLIYYAVGGEQSNVSMQTIIKTTDGGLTWNILYDSAGPWLKSVYFTNTLTGFAVGDSGVILKTANGGNLWGKVIAPVIRDFESIVFINPDTGFIVGGSQRLGRRTILQTADGGTTWSVLIDTAGGILKDISFASAVTGYVVGDSATLLKTIDGGNTWTQQVINNSLSGNETFNAVKFYNTDLGIIGGKAGDLFIYTGWPLNVYTLGPVLQDSTSAFVYASINTHGYPEAINFVYSTDSAFATYQLTPVQSYTTDTFLPISGQLNNLIPNTWYYYFVRGGSITGDTLKFYTGRNPMPAFSTLGGHIIDSTTLGVSGEVHGLNPVSDLAFEYGITPGLGSTIAGNPGLISDNADHIVTAQLNSVLPYTLYYFRLRGVTGPDTLRGDIYYTGNLYHILKALPATYVSDTNATLNGEEEGYPGPVTLKFEYWVSHGPGMNTNQTFNFSKSDTLRTILDGAVGLLPKHFYYYHVKAQSVSGIAYSNTIAFYTGNKDSVIQTLPAIDVNSNSATLVGMANHFTDSGTISFEYGTDSTLGNLIAPATTVLGDSLSHTFTAVLTGVPSNTKYYYRIKVITSYGATISGNILATYIGGNEIPNWDFQNWTTTNYAVPAGWNLAGNTFNRVPGHSGNYAVNLTGDNLIMLGFPKQEAHGIHFVGGDACPGRPDSISFYMKSNIMAGDTPLALIYLHSGNTVIAQQMTPIPVNTNGLWQHVTIPVNYQSALTPDSIVIGFITFNPNAPFSFSASVNNTLTVDDITLIPPVVTLYNADFENWFDIPIETLDDWYFPSFVGLEPTSTSIPFVAKTLFSAPYDYAAEVRNSNIHNVGLIPGVLQSNLQPLSTNQTPSFAVSGKHETLNGFIKSFPLNGDTISVFVNMFLHGIQIGMGQLNLADSLTEFTPFNIPIAYYYPGTPDSSSIQIFMHGINPNVVNSFSSLVIDKLRFDGFADGIMDYTPEVSSFDANGLKVYPNPSRGLITVEVEEPGVGESIIQIYGLNGQKEMELKMPASTQKISFGINDLTGGFYLLKWLNGTKTVNKKIVVIK